MVGFDEPPIMGLMTASFYEERPNQMISPLSSLALKHYKFQYEGFITVGDFDIFKIKVTPKRKSDELVNGYIYIVDKLWCIYSIDFNAQMEIFNYRIKQQYENIGNENWLPVSHNINGNLGMFGLRANFYYGASVKYDSIVDNYLSKKQIGLAAKTGLSDTLVPRKKSVKEKSFIKEVEQISAKENLSNNDVKKVARLNRKILKEQYKDSTIAAPGFNNYNIEDKKDSLNNEISWDTIRAIPLTPGEIRSYQLADSITALETMENDSITGDKKKKKKSVFSKVIFGENDLCKNPLIKLGYKGLISLENFDFNTVDGYKYKQKFEFRINPDSGKYINITPEIAYAFNRKAIFGSLTSQFRNMLGSGNTFGFAVGKESRDFKPAQLGGHPSLNAISSWFFAKNYIKLYETEFLKMNFAQRFKKNFNAFFTVEYNHFYPLQNNITYSLSDKKEYSTNIPKGFSEEGPELQQQKSFVYAVGLNYRKRQQKPWLEKSSFLFMNDFYTFNLFLKQGIKDLFSSVSDFNQIYFSIQQQANISPSTGIDWKINAGYFFNSNQMYFSQFKHFNTSEMPVAFKSFAHTFQMMNDYEFRDCNEIT